MREEIDLKWKELTAKRNLFQAYYMYQAEKLPVLLQQLGKEHEDTGLISTLKHAAAMILVLLHTLTGKD